MTADREIRLKRLVDLRFADISPRDARAAYHSGFPFGVAGLSANAEEREFVERYAGLVLQRQYVLCEDLTPAELADLAERKVSFAARLRFEMSISKARLAKDVSATISRVAEPRPRDSSDPLLPPNAPGG